MSEEQKQPPKYDQGQAKIFGNAPEAKGSNIVSGQTIQGNTFIGTICDNLRKSSKCQENLKSDWGRMGKERLTLS